MGAAMSVCLDTLNGSPLPSPPLQKKSVGEIFAFLCTSNGIFRLNKALG